MREKIKIKILQALLEEVTKKYDDSITEKEKLLQKMFEMAVNDSLTGLYNRQYMQNYLLNLIKKAKRNKNEKFAVIFLDLDNFKSINDSFGHNKGDEILKEVANILKNSFRECDLVSRYGGDEFVIIVENPSFEVLDNLKSRLRNIIETEFKDFEISVSIGFSCFPKDISNVKDEEEIINKLLTIADNRMYENKKERKDKKLS